MIYVNPQTLRDSAVNKEDIPLEGNLIGILDLLSLLVELFQFLNKLKIAASIQIFSFDED